MEDTILEKLIDTDHQKEVGIGRIHVRDSRHSFPIWTENGHVQESQPEKGLVTGLDTLSGKSLCYANKLATRISKGDN